MSIGTTAWLPSTLTCTLQAHYIAHETTPYCPTIPNHRLNGTVYVRQAGVTPVPPLATLWQGKLRPNTDLTHSISVRRTTPARHLNLQHGKWLHPLGGFLLTYNQTFSCNRI